MAKARKKSTGKRPRGKKSATTRTKTKRPRKARKAKSSRPRKARPPARSAKKPVKKSAGRRPSARRHAADLRQRTAALLAGMPSSPPFSAPPASKADLEADISRVKGGG